MHMIGEAPHLASMDDAQLDPTGCSYAPDTLGSTGPSDPKSFL